MKQRPGWENEVDHAGRRNSWSQSSKFGVHLRIPRPARKPVSQGWRSQGTGGGHVTPGLADQRENLVLD